MRSDPFIRRLRAGDTGAILAIYDGAMAVEAGIGPVTRPQWDGFLRQPQNRGGVDFRVALSGGQVIGHAESSLRDQGERLVRYMKLVVAPAYRQRGVASANLLQIDGQGGSVSFQAVAATLRSDLAAAMERRRVHR